MGGKKRVFSLAALALTALVAAWLAGLILFVARIQTFDEPPIDAAMPPVEAIVVLTGGSDRLTTGLDLLKADKGRKLLVSGVYPGLRLDTILARQSVEQRLRDCCIALGHSAADTVGNAEETHQWMRTENFHSLRLVTAHYHMPRSLLIFRAFMPDAQIIPHPVAPETVRLDAWWQNGGTAMLLAREYHKYLLAALRAQFGVLP